MLEPILQSLREVDGVQGAMLLDAGAAIIAHRTHTIYDLPVLQQVARAVASTIDSVQLIQDDWDLLTAHFSDGKLLLRSVRVGAGKQRSYALVVIADSTLNAAFLGVALRVAASKLAVALEAGPPAPSAVPDAGPAATPGPSQAQAQPGRPSVAEPKRPDLSKAALRWSVAGATSTAGSAVGGYSEVKVSDPESSTFLTACTRALGASVGPMAKVFVMEAVRNVCGDRVFSRVDGPALLARLAAGIQDGDERAKFQRVTRAL